MHICVFARLSRGYYYYYYYYYYYHHYYYYMHTRLSHGVIGVRGGTLEDLVPS